MATRRRPAVTERDVIQAAREGRLAIDATGAPVTPSARDAARKLGVTLGPGPPPGSPAQPTVPADQVQKAAAPLRVAIGADHGGVTLKDAILADLRAKGREVTDLGCFGPDPVDYPDFALAVANAVAEGRAELGIMIDGAGIGSCMVANKVPGVRAAMCYDVTTAANAREHNNANVLTLGGTLIGPRLALEIVSVFVATPFGGGRHARRVEKIDQLDSSRAAPLR